jgi:hypothetical protein
MNLQSAVLLVLASLSLTGEGSKIGCIRLPTAEEEPFEVKNVWTYDPPTASLRVDLASVLKTRQVPKDQGPMLRF